MVEKYITTKKTIIFYKDWLPLINSLPQELVLKFWELWSNYDDINYNPQIDNAHLKSVFDYVISIVKENDIKYAKVLSSKSFAGVKSGEARRRKKKIKQIEHNEQN